MLTHCVNTHIDDGYQILKTLWDKGYSPHDIITNTFRVAKTHPLMPEYLKLEFIKVHSLYVGYIHLFFSLKKITFCSEDFKDVF